jgi:hypothetical protein
MTFLQHIAKTSGSRTASSRTLGRQVGLVAREERRFIVAKRLHKVVPQGARPSGITPRNYLAGDPWRGSGP